MIMTIKELKNELGNGKIFNITFVKNNGAIRRFNARLGVHKGLKGKGLSYNPEDRDYLVVFSMDDNGYRTVNTKNILIIKANGRTYKTYKFLELLQ